MVSEHERRKFIKEWKKKNKERIEFGNKKISLEKVSPEMPYVIRDLKKRYENGYKLITLQEIKNIVKRINPEITDDGGHLRKRAELIIRELNKGKVLRKGYMIMKDIEDTGLDIPPPIRKPIVLKNKLPNLNKDFYYESQEVPKVR